MCFGTHNFAINDPKGKKRRLSLRVMDFYVAMETLLKLLEFYWIFLHIVVLTLAMIISWSIGMRIWKYQRVEREKSAWKLNYECESD